MSRDTKHDTVNPPPGWPSANRRRVLKICTLALAAAVVAGTPAKCSLNAAQPGAGFDLSRTTVPREMLLPGGPPRDGIPAIDQDGLPPQLRARDPYAEYRRGPDLMFPAEPVNRRLALKAPVFGVWTAEAARAYPIAAFRDVTEPREFEQEIGGVKVVLAWDPGAKALRIARAEEGVHSTPAFWFAWYAFHPRTELMESARQLTE